MKSPNQSTEPTGGSRLRHYLAESAMKATITSLLFIIAALTSATFAGPAARPTSGVGIPGFAYIRDAKLFKSEKSKDLTPEARRALRFGTGIMALRLETEIRGAFSVAQAAWGYQVNFSRLAVNNGGVWTEVPEGFGEVFSARVWTRSRSIMARESLPNYRAALDGGSAICLSILRHWPAAREHGRSAQ